MDVRATRRTAARSGPRRQGAGSRRAAAAAGLTATVLMTAVAVPR